MVKIDVDILITGDLVCKEFSGGVKSTPAKKKTYMNGSMYIVRLLLTVMFLLTASTARSTRLLCAVQTHAKEVAMGLSNGIITRPVNYEEPYRCLGVGKYNGTWDIGYICSNLHKKTNMWALFKPVDWGNSPDINTKNSQWYKGQNGKCGYNMIVGSGSVIELMIQDVMMGGAEWEYSPGNGMRRINDFNGYNHNAVKPFVDSIIGYRYSQNTDVSDAVIYSNQYEAGYNIEGNFKLTDLTVDGSSCANWYSGILIISKNGDFIAGVTANTTVAQDVKVKASKVYITTEILDRGDYYIIPIISSVKKYGVDAVYTPRGDSWNDGTIVFLPIKMGTLTILTYSESNIWYKVYTTETQVVLNLLGTNKTNYVSYVGTIYTYIEYYDKRAEEEGSNDPWVRIYSSEENVNANIPANTDKYEFRVGGGIAKSSINWQESTKYRVIVEAPYNPSVSASTTVFRDDGEVYG